jgi:hypothetical protein
MGSNNVMAQRQQMNPQFYNSSGGTPYQNHQQMLQQMQIQNMYMQKQGGQNAQLLQNSGASGPQYAYNHRQ